MSFLLQLFLTVCIFLLPTCFSRHKKLNHQGNVRFFSIFFEWISFCIQRNAWMPHWCRFHVLSGYLNHSILLLILKPLCCLPNIPICLCCAVVWGCMLGRWGVAGGGGGGGGGWGVGSGGKLDGVWGKKWKAKIIFIRYVKLKTVLCEHKHCNNT